MYGGSHYTTLRAQMVKDGVVSRVDPIHLIVVSVLRVPRTVGERETLPRECYWRCFRNNWLKGDEEVWNHSDVDIYTRKQHLELTLGVVTPCWCRKQRQSSSCPFRFVMTIALG